MRQTSARQINKLIHTGCNNAVTVPQLMESSGIPDEMVIRTTITILREHGELIFTTEDGRYYRPADTSELEEYKQRRPADLRAMLAFRNMRHYGFNQRAENE